MTTEILRFHYALERDAAIDSWMNMHSGGPGAIAREWFEEMRRRGDEVRELMHDGCPVACRGDAPFGYFNAFRAHVNVGVFQGAALPDPARLLQGSGRFMRHVVHPSCKAAARNGSESHSAEQTDRGGVRGHQVAD